MKIELAVPDICTWILIILYRNKIRMVLYRMYILFEFWMFNIYNNFLE